jgi:SAM-dependent methyltransferase/DNA-binding HxlR family transcriptional regulator
MSAADSTQRKLLELLSGKWVTAAVSTAAELGLADALADGPLSCAELAARLNCDQHALSRLVRVLCGEQLLESQPHGSYALTELGAQLQTGKLRELARFVGAPFMWQPWANLAEAVRDPSRSAFERATGQSLFDHLDRNPEDAHIYHHAVDAFTRAAARALCDAFDFSDLECVVDLGGGLGTVLTELVARYPKLRGVLFDRPQVVKQAGSIFAEQERIELVSGDFFEQVPEGADAFIIKHVLHNWDEPQALRILELCTRALKPNGQVLIVESLLLPGDIRDATAFLDLEMLALCGKGHERGKPQYRKLLQQAGLSLRTTTKLVGEVRLLVAVPRSA